MRPWFRRKTFGYGWTPASWEGWLASLLLIFAFLGIGNPQLVHLDRTARIVCLVALVAAFCVLIQATSGRDSGS